MKRIIRYLGLTSALLAASLTFIGGKEVTKASAVITFALELDVNTSNSNIYSEGWLSGSTYTTIYSGGQYYLDIADPILDGDHWYVTINSNTGNVLLGSFVLYHFVNGVWTYYGTVPLYFPSGGSSSQIGDIHFNNATGVLSITWHATH